MKRLLLILTTLFFIGQVQPSGPADALKAFGTEIASATTKCSGSLYTAARQFDTSKFSADALNCIKKHPASAKFAGIYTLYLAYGWSKINRKASCDSDYNHDEKQSNRAMWALFPVTYYALGYFFGRHEAPVADSLGAAAGGLGIAIVLFDSILN